MEKGNKGLLHQGEKREAKHDLFSTEARFHTKTKNIKFSLEKEAGSFFWLDAIE